MHTVIHAKCHGGSCGRSWRAGSGGAYGLRCVIEQLMQQLDGGCARRTWSGLCGPFLPRNQPKRPPPGAGSTSMMALGRWRRRGLNLNRTPYRAAASRCTAAV